ncbi:MAG: hypothetical protein GEU93_20590 [Propionibacteriales bacterium]|nr:hypothetical protein [Propionibacteriales bacterium]
MVMRSAAVFVITLGLSLICPPAPAGPSTETFRGTCDLTLTVRHQPSLTTALASGQVWARGSGTCTGGLTRASGRVVLLDEAPVDIRATGAGELSCGGGVAQGTGVLSFGGEKIGFNFEEIRGPGVATLYYTGSAAGSALGEAYISPDEDPAETAAACTGTGLRRVEVQEQLVSNGISG